MHDSYDHPIEAKAEHDAAIYAEIERDLRATGDEADDLRADMLGYFDAADLQRERDEEGLGAVRQAVDDGGHWCVDCGEARIPGHPVTDAGCCDGPICAPCLDARHGTSADPMLGTGGV